jgi:hypothetical protein
MESARSFGNYDIASAVADLIDNSIAARAKVIDVSCLWNDGIPEIRVCDDGAGMDAETLHIAMRPASTSPTEERAPNDLGRFGLGLKTASFSQCRCLTVVSVADGKWSGARWDLDRLNEWSMEVFSRNEICALTKLSDDLSSGTEVIWTKLDRLTEGGALSSDSFNELINHARARLALTYHRFLEPERGRRGLQIKVNGLNLKPFDPFHEKHPATQQLPQETFLVNGRIKVTVTPFILPHYSKMSSDEYESLAGEEGYLRNQGFYIYRNRRLIIHGTWFRLVRHGDLSKLARIRIDIPNSLDEEWKITVDKSDAQIPSFLRNRLRSLIDRIRDSSVHVYRNRGGKIDRKDVVSVWERTVKQGVISYTINRKHAVISQFRSTLEGSATSDLDHVLGLIEQSFPVETLFADASDRPNAVAQIATDPDELKQMTRRFVEKYLKNVGDTETLLSILAGTDPFRSNKNIVEEELERAGVKYD